MSGEPDDVFDGDPFDPAVVAAAETANYEETNTEDEAVKAYIRRRANAYRAVFAEATPELNFVLADLARFCRAYESR